MLAMNMNLMQQLDTPHLLSALYAEGPMTPAEIELARRLDALTGQGTPEEVANRVENSFEAAMEQSGFRAHALREILELCEKPGSKKALVAAIKITVENSYVEL